MAMIEHSDDFLNDAAESLTVAAQGYRRRRARHRQWVFGGLAVCVAASVIAIAVSQRGAQADVVQISIANGVVKIAVVDPAVAPAAIERRLVKAGITVTREEVSTGPSRVGHLVGLRGEGSGGTDALTVRVRV